MRAAIIAMPTELIGKMLGLPEDVSIRNLWGDPMSDSIKIVLQSDVRFKPVPAGQQITQIWPHIEMRLMPAPPVSPDEYRSSPAPNEDDVLFVRFVLDDLPAPDEGATE